MSAEFLSYVMPQEPQMSAASHDTDPKTIVYPPKEPRMLIPDSKPLTPRQEAEMLETSRNMLVNPLDPNHVIPEQEKVMPAETKLYHGGREGGKAFKPTAAQQAMCNLLDGINALPAWEQAEVAEVKEILERLLLRYGSSAHLAMMGVCINTAIEKGE